MSKLVGLLAIGVLVGISAASPAAADYKDGLLKPGTMVVATTGSAPPVSMIDAQGQIAGYDIDVAKKVGEDLGLKVEFVQIDDSALLPGLAAGRFDVVASGIPWTKERAASTDFTLVAPDLLNGVAILKLATNTKINGWNDVCGTRRGTVRGSDVNLSDALPAGCTVTDVDYPGWTEMMLDLKNGRIDWIGQDYLGPVYLARTDPSLVVVPDVRHRTTQGLAVSGKEHDLATAIDGLMNKYRTDGTLDALIMKWYGVKVDWTQMPTH